MQRAISIISVATASLVLAGTARASVLVSACNTFAPPDPVAADTSGQCRNDTPTGTPGFGSASANLATGVLAAVAKGVFANNGSASAHFSDTITILGGLVGPLGVNISLGVHGVVSGPAQSSPTLNGSGEVITAGFGVTGAITNNQGSVILRDYSGTNVVPLTNETFFSGTGLSEGVGSPYPNDIEFHIADDVMVDGAHPSFTFTADIGAFAQPIQFPLGALETVDLGDTATLTLTLPNGFSFTSASGVLLSQVPGTTAAPEPSSLAILVSALAAVGWSASRVRVRRDHSKLTIAAAGGEDC